MKKYFLKIEHVTTTFAMVAACFLLALAAALGVFQILMRFVFSQPSEWTEVVIRFSLIWMVFLALSAAFRQGAMVRVDALYRWCPIKYRLILDTIICLATLVLMLFIIWWGWDYAVRGQMQTMSGIESLSMFSAYLALPVGAVFSLFGIIANFLDPIRLDLEAAQ
jgi:TRAP-type C4-dicarboxylate transport system permease small subunit